MRSFVGRGLVFVLALAALATVAAAASMATAAAGTAGAAGPQGRAVGLAPGIDPACLAAGEASGRLVVVLGQGSAVTVHALERKDGQWTEVFQCKGFSGRKGISASKKEGDGATPAGVFVMRRAFGIKDNPGAHLPYTKVGPDDYWVDDPKSRHYNTWVTGRSAGKDWKSAEHLIAETVAYDHAVVIEYNTKPIVKGAGSAIFLHCSRGRPTEGCVSVPAPYMVRLLRFIKPGDKIVIQ